MPTDSALMLFVGVGLLVGTAAASSLSAVLAVVGFGALVVTGWSADRWAVGVLVGLVAIATCNAIPGSDLSTFSVGPAAVFDLGAAVLVGLAVGTAARSDHRFTAAARAMAVWAGLMGVLCAVATVRGGLMAGLSIDNRDLFYMAVCPLAAVVILVDATSRRFTAWTLIAGFVCFTLAFVGVGVQALPSDFVNAHTSASVSSFTRSFTVAQAGLPWVTSMAVGFAIFGPRRIRLAMMTVAVIGLVALFMTFTRMLYIGAVLTTLIGVGVAGTALGRGVRRRLLVVVATVLVGLVVTVPMADNQPLIQAALSRFVTPSGSIGDSERTTVIRLRTVSAIIHRVDSSWLYGLGFRDSQNLQYEADLPRGSLRNSDIGYMSAYGPLGLIGVLSLIGLNVYGLVSCFPAIRIAARRGRSLDAGLVTGGGLWLLFTTLTAVTVAFFLRVEGAVVTSIFLALVLSAADAIRQHAEDASPV